MPSSLFIPQDYKSCGADFTPGIVIMLLVLSFMMVGNGLRDALDTRMSDDKPIGSS